MFSTTYDCDPPSDRTITHSVAVATVKKATHQFFDLFKFSTQETYDWNFSKKAGFIDNGDVRVDFPCPSITGIYAKSVLEAHARMNALWDILNNVSVLTINRPGFN